MAIHGHSWLCRGFGGVPTALSGIFNLIEEWMDVQSIWWGLDKWMPIQTPSAQRLKEEECPD
jgi:hypothetical protein